MKTRVKILLPLLLLCLVCFALTLCVSAETRTGTCGDNLTYTLDTDTGVLTISGTGEMTDWADLHTPWSGAQTSLSAVIIEDGVKSIGTNAFAFCSGFDRITIPKSVTRIGEGAFTGCALTAIDVDAENPAFTSLSGALFSKDRTTLFAVPYTWSGAYAIPEGVTHIANRAFFFDTNLTDITIPESVTHIGDVAFAYCQNLTSLTIPAAVTHIAEDAFSGCSRLARIDVDAENPSFESLSGVLFEASRRVLRFVPYTQTGVYVIPEDVRRIGVSAFSNCRSLTGITIPASVERIGNLAFSNCRSLPEIHIPDGVKHIGDAAFASCKALKTLVFPQSVVRIGQHATMECSGLETVVILDAACSIGDNAFSDRITICGYTDSTAEAYAKANDCDFVALDAHDHTFSADFTADTAATCGVAGEKSRHCTVYGCTERTEITSIPATGVHTYVDGVCTGCGTETGFCGNYGNNLTYTLNPTTGVLTISGTGEIAHWNSGNKSPFAGDGRIRKVVVEGGVTYIYRETFENCSRLAVVELAASVAKTGYKAFAGCNALTDITILHPQCEIYSISTVPKTTAIHGYIYSTAETYAKANNLKFVSLGVAPHEHIFAADFTPDIPATCVAPGEKSRHCTVLGCPEKTDVQSIPIDDTAHDWEGEYTVDRLETCAKEGEKSRHCTRCTARINVTVIPKKPHSYGDWQVRIPAKCEETGEDYRICTVCKYEEPRESEALGHNFAKAWIIDTPATCVTDGKKSWHCTRCDAKRFETKIPATGVHVYRDYACLYCDARTDVYKIGDRIVRGSYPQTRVTDEKLLDALNAADGAWVSYGYYLKGQPNDYMQYKDVELDGEKYRAVQFSTYRPQKTYDEAYKPGSESGAEQYENGYFAGKVYWFRYEPMVWRVLDTTYAKNLLVLAESVLDAQPFAARGNHYAESDIRAWLNDSFMHTAFSAEEEKSLYSAADGDVNLGKVFLLSLDEAASASYGLSDPETRCAMGTDYAKAQGLAYDLYSGYAKWLVRTAEDSSSRVYQYGYTGNADPTQAYFNFSGVRPAVRLNPTGKACTHDWSFAGTQAPTCVEDGYTAYSCALCGATRTDVIPASGSHRFDTAFTEDTPATCTAVGKKSRHCTAPGCTAVTEETEIPMTPHTYVDGKCTGCGYYPGDINGDGKISKTDLLLLQKKLAGWDVKLGK